MVTATERQATSRPNPKHKKRNLVSLVWPVNTCYSTLISGVPKDVTLDLVAGTWTFRGQTQAIGSRCYPVYGRTGDPIGVYDRRLLRHLEAFKNDCEWVRTRNNPSGDD